MLAALEWVISSSPWDGMSGSMCGPPQWRKGRSYLDTPAREVKIASIVRAEWSHLKRSAPPPVAPAPPPKKRTSRRR